MLNLIRILPVAALCLLCESSWADSGPNDNFLIPAGCEAKQPANTTWGRVDLWDGDVVQINAERFEQIFDQFWPATQSVERQIVVRRSEYAALKLIASLTGDSGMLTFSAGAIASPSRTVSISECPGQFEDVPPNCARTFDSGFLSWQVGGESDEHCVLKPGDIYYFNLINAAPPDLSVPICPVSACTNLVRIQGPGSSAPQAVPVGSAWAWGLLLMLMALLAVRYHRA